MTERCKATTKAGNPCTYKATHGSHCRNHAPELAEMRRAFGLHGSKGGRPPQNGQRSTASKKGGSTRGQGGSARSPSTSGGAACSGSSSTGTSDESESSTPQYLPPKVDLTTVAGQARYLDWLAEMVFTAQLEPAQSRELRAIVEAHARLKASPTTGDKRNDSAETAFLKLLKGEVQR